MVSGKYKVCVSRWGAKIWNFNGKIHRNEGPAIIYLDGRIFWYLNGRWVLEKQHRYERLSVVKRL